jgi:hypothetical protein
LTGRWREQSCEKTFHKGLSRFGRTYAILDTAISDYPSLSSLDFRYGIPFFPARLSLVLLVICTYKFYGCCEQESQSKEFMSWCSRHRISCSMKRWTLSRLGKSKTSSPPDLSCKAHEARVCVAWAAERICAEADENPRDRCT